MVAAPAEKATSRIIDLFFARSDTWPYQFWSAERQMGGYSKACAGRPPWVQERCQKREGQTPCGQCRHFQPLPVNEYVVERHLAGEITMGSYQLTQDGHSVRWACLDFDDNGQSTPQELQTAALNAYASLEDLGMYASLEASGGKGWRCHIWAFFSSPVEARKVRIILNAALEQCELGKFPFIERFPKQDSAPNGYGSLVKLPFGVHRKTGNRSYFLDPDSLNPITSLETALASIRSIDPVAVDMAIDVRSLAGPSDDTRLSAPTREFNHNPELLRSVLRCCRYFRMLEHYQALPSYSVHYEDWWNLILMAARFGVAGANYADEFSQKDGRYDGEYTGHLIEYIRAHGYHAPSCRRLREGPGLIHCDKDPIHCGAPNAEGKHLFDGTEWQGRDVTRYPPRVVVDLHSSGYF